jgi:hypothetical protein
MTQLTREFTSDIEIRADGTGRTVHGILVPYGQVARVSDGGPAYDEEFAPGAFARDLAARAGNYGGVKFLYQHNRTEPIGRAIDLREDGAGLYGSFKISDTVRGNEALELLRDGVLDSFSIGFKPLQEDYRGGVTVRTKAALRETSLVTFPAYAGALVAGVRNLTDEDIETSPDLGGSADTTAPEVRADQPEPTPDSDSAPATPLGGLTPAQRRLRLIPTH